MIKLQPVIQFRRAPTHLKQTTLSPRAPSERAEMWKLECGSGAAALLLGACSPRALLLSPPASWWDGKG